MYNGICVIHAFYEGPPDIIELMRKRSYVSEVDTKKNNKRNQSLNNSIQNIDECKLPIDQIENMKINNNHQHRQHERQDSQDSIFDFNNFMPDKIRVVRGLGYIRTIMDHQYVITCNHIIIKYCKYKGYCLDDNHTIEFDMIIHKRIPEIDIVILKITSISFPIKYNLSKSHILPELLYDSKILENYDNMIMVNTIITAEYIPDIINSNKNKEIEYKIMNVNNNMTLMFDILVSKNVHQFPMLNIPIENMDIMLSSMKYYKDRKIDLSIIANRKRLFSEIMANFAGTSGSIVRSNDQNIAMICLCTNTNNGFSLKAIPLFMIEMIAKNIIMKNIHNFLGIQIDTYACDLEYQSEKIYAHCVNKQSCPYNNGKRNFIFAVNNIILEVDNKKFNKNQCLWCDLLDMYVPLNTYLMIKSNLEPLIPTSIKVVKQNNGDTKIRIHNLMSIAYNDMHEIRITSNNYHYWNGNIFMELSEELLNFYKRFGILLNNTKIKNVEKERKEEKSPDIKNININTHVKKRTIILFNYQKLLPQTMTQEAYLLMPCQDKQRRYFYVVNSIGQKKINNIEELKTILNTIGAQKKITFKLMNDIGVIKMLKIVI